MHIYVRQANVNIKWKLRGFNAIVNAKLTYGLETLKFLPGNEKRIYGVFYRGLRKILKWDTTFVNRDNSNENPLKEANRHRTLDSNEYRPRQR